MVGLVRALEAASLLHGLLGWIAAPRVDKAPGLTLQLRLLVLVPLHQGARQHHVVVRAELADGLGVRAGVKELVLVHGAVVAVLGAALAARAGARLLVLGLLCPGVHRLHVAVLAVAAVAVAVAAVAALLAAGLLVAGLLAELAALAVVALGALVVVKVLALLVVALRNISRDSLILPALTVLGFNFPCLLAEVSAEELSRVLAALVLFALGSSVIALVASEFLVVSCNTILSSSIA